LNKIGLQLRSPHLSERDQSSAPPTEESTRGPIALRCLDVFALPGEIPVGQARLFRLPSTPSRRDSAAAFTEIEVRQDHDGAGPSHIFHQHDSVVAVVDPLDGTISTYADTHGEPVRTASVPVGFHPWRLVRLPGSVAIISEDGRSRIEVARDQTAWPREHHASDAAYRVAPLVRTSGGISLRPFRGPGALPIRAIGPTTSQARASLSASATGGATCSGRSTT
jgi:hypothetical protein